MSKQWVLPEKYKEMAGMFKQLPVSESRDEDGETVAYFVGENRIANAEYVLSLQAEVTALREALEWQPIETAPKDGSEVLLLDGCIKTARFYERFKRYESDPNPLSNIWFEGVEYGYPLFAYNPTHWMPLPKKPEAALKGGK